ncbi:DUF5666 domain-containing protein [Photobacterium angustum]|uniref:DUF5666 domain-containing protein n=1 Tax=Photobacterium angustum TaxID=661 RepID=UPI0005DEED7B|nr:DUF5666 domain-containing protein [Photobacterium angustum]KJG18816.1 hypothetical protein UA33_01875 [Photobacterium angustum]KJG25626.1 hypothetical protein UA39_02100 [Photobacterium angustum]KJG33808.1 hypothetical protein UA36_02145 [Photobacterium angustum]PSW95773.1 hypothetical protein C0W79_06930 [Photobacterium angustum]PSX01273.1 hypothetical protein C0W87_14270 [Photobacterium angustum]
MKKLLLAVVVGVALSGCGGGGGSDESKPTPPPVVDIKPTAAQGTIKSVNYDNNTIDVNGHSYKVEQVKYGSQELSITSLKPNMMVEVSMLTRSGAVVSVEPTMVGVVTTISADRKTFVVNGVTLSFALDRHIELHDWVMVSSLPQATADGLGYKVLSVVKIEQEDVAGQYEIEGRLSDLDQNTQTFKLGATTNVYFGDAIIEDNATLTNGQWVEVKGQLGVNSFDAREVEVETYDDFDNDHEIEGIVTWVNSDKSQFELNARGRFTVNAQTRFEDGTKANLAAGELVEVTAFNGIAKEIEFERDFGGETGDWREFDREGNVTSVGDDHFMIAGETFYVDAYTEFEDFLTLDTLHGQYVDVEGVLINGKKVAREIEREDD